MLEPRTHFEQVPLEIVRKIVAVQMQRELEAAQTQGSKEKTSEEGLLRLQEQSIAMTGRISRVEAQKQS